MKDARYQNLETGKPKQFRARGQMGSWWVEGTDRNGVWVDAEPAGFRYPSKGLAIEAAETLAADVNGEVIDR